MFELSPVLFTVSPNNSSSPFLRMLVLFFSFCFSIFILLKYFFTKFGSQFFKIGCTLIGGAENFFLFQVPVICWLNLFFCLSAVDWSNPCIGEKLHSSSFLKNDYITTKYWITVIPSYSITIAILWISSYPAQVGRTFPTLLLKFNETCLSFGNIQKLAKCGLSCQLLTNFFFLFRLCYDVFIVSPVSTMMRPFWNEKVLSVACHGLGNTLSIQFNLFPFSYHVIFVNNTWHMPLLSHVLNRT